MKRYIKRAPNLGSDESSGTAAVFEGSCTHDRNVGRKAMDNGRARGSINYCYGQFRASPRRCRSCLIQRICAEDSRENRAETGRVACYGQHPLGMDHPCLHCRQREQCARETTTTPNNGANKKRRKQS